MAAAGARGDVLRHLSRVRHFHFPDMPPFYVPRNVVRPVLDSTEECMRAAGILRESDLDHPYWFSLTPRSSWGLSKVLYWLPFQSPPPLVVSFTSQPSFVLPSALRRLFSGVPTTSTLGPRASTASLRVAMPPPPGWRPEPWELSMKAPDTRRSTRSRDALLQTTWDYIYGAATLVDDCEWTNFRSPDLAVPSYHGPGILSLVNCLDIWGVGDKEVVAQMIADRLAVLEKTTIAVLAHEYGLAAYTLHGCSGLWVDSQHRGTERKSARPKWRQIATIHTVRREWAIRFDVSIHVGAPSIEMVKDGSPAENPWVRLGQANEVTSVVAELNEDTQRRCAELGGPSPYLVYRIPRKEDSVADTGLVNAEPPAPYSLHKRKSPVEDSSYSAKPPVENPAYSTKPRSLWVPQEPYTAPLGMDNYELATAWTVEFAAQLGIEDVDKLTRGFRWFRTTVSETRTSAALPALPRVGSMHVDIVDADLEHSKQLHLKRDRDSNTRARGAEYIPLWTVFSFQARDKFKAAASASRAKQAWESDTRVYHLREDTRKRARKVRKSEIAARRKEGRQEQEEEEEEEEGGRTEEEEQKKAWKKAKKPGKTHIKSPPVSRMAFPR